MDAASKKQMLKTLIRPVSGLGVGLVARGGEG